MPDTGTRQFNRLQRYAAAGVFVVAAALVRWALPHVLGSTPFLAFYPAVVAAAGFGGFGPGILSVFASWLSVALLFDDTPGILGLDDPIILGRLLVFAGGGIGVSLISEMQIRGKRRREEQALELRKNEEQLRLATSATEIGVWSWKPETNEIAVSSNWKRLFGVDPDTEVTFEAWENILHPEDRQRVLNEFNQAKESRRELSTEYRALRPDGTVVWVVDRGRAWYDKTGRAIGMAGINLDITERKRAEEALRQSEERLRAMFDNAGVGIVEVDRDDHFIAVNQRGCEILKRSYDELLTMNVHELTWPEDRPLSDQLNAQLHSGVRDRIDYQKRYTRGDGSPVWVHMTVSAIRDSKGRWIRSIATVEDITDRKLAEAALKQSESFYRQMLESIPGMVFTTRADGYCDYQSQQWVDYTGVPMNEHLGDGWTKLLHPDDRPKAYSAWRAAVGGKAPYDLEYRVRRQDGEYEWFKVIGRPIRDAEGRIVRWFGVAMRVEDLKRAENSLRESETRLMRLNKELDQRASDLLDAKSAAEQANRAKDHFLAVLSHELRTPLTPVMMGVSLLQKQRLVPAADETLNMIRSNVEMEARLIDDLLDVTRIAQGKIELNRTPVQLSTVIERAVDVCRADIEARKLHFGVDMGPGGAYWINADASRLQQVFWNLLKNAIKFTPHGGCVGIRCQLNNTHVLVEVNDTGIGIEPDSLERIFNAFEQAEQSRDRQFGGLGLGLAISKALVELHQGTISAHSRGRNTGATFRITLPLGTPSNVPDSVRHERAQVVRPLHILLVEDHGVTARMLSQVLAAEGHEVVVAGAVADALEATRQHGFDLLLSDLGLPDGTGHDLMQQLRAAGFSFPGIALSGYGQESDIQQSYRSGFAAHLVKPASREKLNEAIASVLEK